MLCGCTGKPSKPQSITVNRTFSCPVYVEQSGKAFTADLVSTENSCKAVFLLPEEIEGLTVEYSDGALKYSLDSLQFDKPPTASLQSQFVKLLYDALHDTAGQAVNEKDFYRVQGSTASGEYYMNIHKETLQPTYFEMDGLDLTVRFG